MKKNTLCLMLLVALFSTVGVVGQEDNFSCTYKVWEKDLTNNLYKKDSLASALVIYESGNSLIEQSDYSVVTKYKKKI